MKLVFYITLLSIILWISIFLKPELLPHKKDNCLDNIQLLYLDSYKVAHFCSKIKELATISSIGGNIKIVILPKWLFRIFSLSSSKYSLNLLNGYIFVDRDGVEKFDRVSFFERLVSFRILSRKTLLSYLAIPKWKIIGYSRYIMDEVDRFSVKDICDENRKGEKGYKEFENKMVVRYIFERKGYREKEFFDDNLSYSFYLDEAKMYYCR